MDRRTLAIGSLLLCGAARCAWAADGLTLAKALELAQKPAVQGELARSRYAMEQAAGAVRLAEGAFQWSAGASAGVTRVYQPGISGNFLTSDTQRYDVPTSTVFAERQFENGIKLRPSYLFTQPVTDFRAEIARLNTRPLLELEIPLDRRFGEPADALRLSAARSDLAAATSNRGLARQAQVHAVVVALWRVLAAQRRSTVDGTLAERLATVANRMARLASSGEVATVQAAEIRARASLAEVNVDRDSVELAAARLELARLLAMPVNELPPVEAEFPDPAAASLEALRPDALVEEALARRPDLKAQQQRVDAARLRGRIRSRDADSRLSFSIAPDRVMLNWITPLGDARSAGASQEAAGEIGVAEAALEDARLRVRAETRIAFERVVITRRTVPRTEAAAQALRDRVTLVGGLVDKGRQPPVTLADAAEQFASASRQALDARLLFALALADLRLATAAIPEDAVESQTLASLFLSMP